MSWRSVLLWLLLPLPVQAADLPRVPVGSTVEVQQYLERIKRGLGNATIVTDDPRGSRLGRFGDQIVFQDGNSYRLCTSTSEGPDPGRSWSCDELNDTGVCFEGSSNDAFETCLSVTNPTADNTITVPNQGGDLLVIANGLQGDVVYHNGSTWTRLGAGTSGQFFKTQGASANPLWADVAQPLKFIETLTLSGAEVNSATFPTDATMFLLLFDKADTSAGDLQMTFNDDTSAIYTTVWLDGTTPSIGRTAAASTFQVSTGAVPVDGTATFRRDATSGLGAGVAFDLSSPSAANDQLATVGEYAVNNTALTQVDIRCSACTLSGKVHIYKFDDS